MSRFLRMLEAAMRLAWRLSYRTQVAACIWIWLTPHSNRIPMAAQSMSR